MRSMWEDGISDREYLDQFSAGDGLADDEDERCSNCGARPEEACEEWCASGRNEMAEAELARELRTEFGPDSDKE